MGDEKCEINCTELNSVCYTGKATLTMQLFLQKHEKYLATPDRELATDQNDDSSKA